jgi:hypothetical protein
VEIVASRSSRAMSCRQFSVIDGLRLTATSFHNS